MEILNNESYISKLNATDVMLSNIYVVFLFCRELQETLTLKENGLMEGSRIVLIPNVETGLLVSFLRFSFEFVICIHIVKM